MKTVLVVDDEKSVRESIRMILKDSYNVRATGNGSETMKLLEKDEIDLVILDILMPSIDGLSVLRAIKKESSVAVIMLTAVDRVRVAVEAMKLGASDYIVKPFDAEELQLIVDKNITSRKKEEELNYLRGEIERNYPTRHIVAESPAMKQILDRVKRVAATASTVLITGESGTGKELIARSVHQQSTRSPMPFIAVQCAAIPEGILESELFGHEKGAFTGATRSRRGMFELAEAGTLFLDEISEMNMSTQVKILRSLQEKEFMRVGGQTPVKVDVRLIAATNRNLGRLVSEGRFREDLFFRLNVIPIHIPPLRERREDIGPLTEYFFKRFSIELHASPKELSEEALAILMKYPWPGNVRELKNVIERSVALEPAAQVLLPSHLHLDWVGGAGEYEGSLSQPLACDSLEEAGQELERRLILEALHQNSWVQTEAARSLKISRRKLKYRMDRLGIPPRRNKQPKRDAASL